MSEGQQFYDWTMPLEDAEFSRLRWQKWLQWHYIEPTQPTYNWQLLDQTVQRIEMETKGLRSDERTE